MNKKRVILWFRSDLRLHDNEALHDAIAHASELYPIYVFDDRTFNGQTEHGLRKMDRFRSRFILDSVSNLRLSLRRLGSDLIIRSGRPEEIIFQLAKDLKTKWVFCNRERTDEEVKVQDQLERNLWSIGQEVRYSRGKMLYYTADLPFPVTHAPDSFTQFRKEVEKIVAIRAPLPTPHKLPLIEYPIDAGELPEMMDWGYSKEEIVETNDLVSTPGEECGLERLKDYIWETEDLCHLKSTCDNLLGDGNSSKFSAYLSHGCLSPKLVYQESKKFEQDRLKNESTHHLYLELLRRDFYRLVGKKHGNDIFKKRGINQKVMPGLNDDEALFRIWTEGRTGMPFVDAAMTQLNTTGYMPNRARQIVATFLVSDLHLNWQMGAAYFESLLIDYDPCSNWGNWNFIASTSFNANEGRGCRPVRQAKRYDPEGQYVKKWLPVLFDLPTDKIHQPFLLSPAEQTEFNCILHKDYPDLCINKEAYL